MQPAGDQSAEDPARPDLDPEIDPVRRRADRIKESDRSRDLPEQVRADVDILK